MKTTWKSGLKIACLLFVCLTITAIPAQSEAALRVGLGFSGATGEVGDYLIGGGLLAGGDLYFPVNTMFYVGGGLDVSLHSGQDVSAGVVSVATTDLGFVVTFEVGGLLYLVGPEGNVRPYLRGTVGRGGMAWHYTRSGEVVAGTEGDGVGFFLFSPAVGFDGKVSEGVSAGFELRAVLNSYSDETSEGLPFIFDDGNLIQARGFIRVRL